MAQGSSCKRKKPNVLVTGTPGTGRTTLSTALAEATQLRHINTEDLVKEKNLHDGWDDELDCFILNEDLVCDELEDVMEEGGNIVDYHGCEPVIYFLSDGLIMWLYFKLITLCCMAV